ncbi:hypothetical protein Cfor_05796 [Coptotermes formosanus]|uniref:Endonuclease/exonuclease/phosphatase domain-containing protein n=1 Tax=Coptotermes formosanus TaxID=36987 RepID=A0A6L2PX72_COPFO|nr:hypothetical protein Cfor_05796 [Coptotermes formosanus]
MDMKSHTLFYSGKEKETGESGVSFVVDRSTKRNILDFQAVGERTCVLRIQTTFLYLSFINVYAPIQENKEIEKEAFYQKLEVHHECPSSDIKILVGDLNAKIRRDEISQGPTGRYSSHLKSNNNGQKPLDFATQKSMVVSSTCYPHKDIHKQTWRSHDGKINNLTNHILIHKRNASSITDVKSCRGANSDSNHFLVKRKYRCKIAYRKHGTNRNLKRRNVEKLAEPSICTNYQQQLQKELEKNERERTVQELAHMQEEWKQIKEVMMEVALQTAGYQPKQDNREWIDENTKSLQMRKI